MDFMKWLNSLDELLYEVMSWVIFFPLTLWRSLVRPIGVMAEIEREAALPDDERFNSVLSPPLFLTLALLLTHTITTALGQVDQIIANHHGLADLVDDNASALALRVVVFAGFPIFLAARMVRKLGLRLSRHTLQQPFYEQCYPAAVFALGVGVGTSMTDYQNDTIPTIGHVVWASSLLNFWIVETRWFHHVLKRGYISAGWNVFIGLLEGGLFLLALGYLFTR
jgi:hypothetical protein